MPPHRQALDANGQPVNRALNAQRLLDRGADELLGICRGLVADGDVNEAETRFLVSWLESNAGVACQWPGNVIYARAYEFLRDGRLDAGERAELLELLSRVSGHVAGADQVQAAATPYDDPQPRIQFDERVFVVTGQFAYGNRREVTDAIHDLGGWVRPNVIRDTDYVVVGTLASPDWAHASYGRKIEAALALRSAGVGIHIVSEDHWAEHLVTA
ncbi:MAG TPA: BRCT domain-containing protein [Solidesulfovibrio magneticus]|nr:BRCT domain-containing protein [Solidesulfovibrio magneticus]